MRHEGRVRKKYLGLLLGRSKESTNFGSLLVPLHGSGTGGYRREGSKQSDQNGYVEFSEES